MTGSYGEKSQLFFSFRSSFLRISGAVSLRLIYGHSQEYYYGVIAMEYK